MSKHRLHPETDVTVRRKIQLWSVVFLVLFAIGTYYFLPRFGELSDIADAIRGASWTWVAGAFALALMTHVISGYVQYHAGAGVGRFGRITLIQLAGSFISHFLPFSLGTTGLATLYYERLGMSRPRALTAALLPIIFGVATTLILAVVIMPLTVAQAINRYSSGMSDVSVVIGGLFATTVAVLAAALYWPHSRRVWRQVKSAINAIDSPLQLFRLTIGSLTLTMISALSLAAAMTAIQVHIGIASLLTLYIVTTLVGNAAPTPGGLGATEATIILGLHSFGVALPAATAATLIFRFVSFWLPIIPGGIALALLRHQGLRLL